MKGIFIILLLIILAASLAFKQPVVHPSGDEFYIIAEAPVTVGGGLARHYFTENNKSIFARYSYGGVYSNTLYIIKTLRIKSALGKSTKEEFIRLPLQYFEGAKKAPLAIGRHNLHLELTGDNRLSIEEIN